MISKDEQKVVVDLAHSQALVLFEWLAKHDGALPVDDTAEQAVLWRLEGALEAVLVEHLAPDYRALVAAAKARIQPSEEVNGSEDELLRIAKLCNAAAPGPWLSFIEGRDHQSGSDFIRTPQGDIELSGASHADQDFIASARQGVPLLLEEIRRLRATISTLEEANLRLTAVGSC